MRRAWTWWLAWGVLLVTFALFAFAALIIQTVGHSAATNQNGWLARGAILASFIGFALVGALVASRLPRNPVGWIFSAVALLVGLNVAGGEYANYVFVEHPGSHPGGYLAAWLFLWTWFPVVGLVVMLPLLFPDGRVPSPRWRPVLWAEIAFATAIAVLWMVRPGPLSDPGKPLYPDNPLGIGFLDPIYGSLEVVGSLILVSLLSLSGAAAVVRFRRAHGDERQQLKWMAYGIGALVFLIPLSFAPGDYGNFFFALVLGVLPAATAIAMFKYRLYEIDRVISRTLVYGALTVILGAAYAGLVLAGQALFSSFAGGSNLAIAGSTLVVAALFLPLRSRVQLVVDRRFYRSRYDAQRTLEAFGARLRQEVDLVALSGELLGVVDETMQPAHVTVWLRSAR
jgi:hypothetical protein